MTNERALFLKEFLINPMGMGSITPSSHYLTQHMLKNLSWDSIGSIVELGAGTGVFTAYIREHKNADCLFLAVEKDEMLHFRLQQKYPDMIIGKDAKNLVPLLYENRIGRVDCIISALPFALMRQDEREQIIASVSNAITSEGTFVLYQYSLQMRKLLKRYFREVHISLEIRNFPPAFVYVCKK